MKLHLISMFFKKKKKKKTTTKNKKKLTVNDDDDDEDDGSSKITLEYQKSFSERSQHRYIKKNCILKKKKKKKKEKKKNINITILLVISEPIEKCWAVISGALIVWLVSKTVGTDKQTLLRKKGNIIQVSLKAYPLLLSFIDTVPWYCRTNNQVSHNKKQLKFKKKAWKKLLLKI